MPMKAMFVLFTFLAVMPVNAAINEAQFQRGYHLIPKLSFIVIQGEGTPWERAPFVGLNRIIKKSSPVHAQESRALLL